MSVLDPFQVLRLIVFSANISLFKIFRILSLKNIFVELLIVDHDGERDILVVLLHVRFF